MESRRGCQLAWLSPLLRTRVQNSPKSCSWLTSNLASGIPSDIVVQKYAVDLTPNPMSNTRPNLNILKITFMYKSESDSSFKLQYFNYHDCWSRKQGKGQNNSWRKFQRGVLNTVDTSRIL